MTQFVIEVVVDPTRATRGAKKVRGELDRTETAAGKLQKSLRNAVAVVGVAATVRQLGRLADTYTNIQNRLRTVTDGTKELSDVTAELFEISNRTRSSFEGTAEVYARVALAAQDLGRSQAELLQFTESLNQAVILSGASATEAKAGLIQLSQGLASGALRGEELNSVLEQLPVVADVIAESLGVTRGELRKLGSEGKISAEIVLDAFKKSRVELEERFGEAVPTLGQSFGVLENNIIRYIGTADEATGASSSLSAAILAAADNVELLAAGLGTLGITIAAVKLAPFATGAIEAASAFAKLRISVLAGNSVILGSAAATKLQAIAEVDAAAASVARTAATIAGIEAQSAKALSTAVGAEVDFAALAVEKQLVAVRATHTTATNALAAAQGRLATATAATTVQARILSLVNPFAVAVVGIAAFGFALNHIADELVEVEKRMNDIAAAGNKLELTAFAQVGDDIVRLRDLISRVQTEIDRDINTKGFANPTAIAVLERYTQKLEDLTGKQELLRDGTAKTTAEAEEQLAAMKALSVALDASIGDIQQQTQLLNLNSRERGIQASLLREIAALEKEGGPDLTDTQKSELEAALRRNQALAEQAEALDRIRGPQEQFATDLQAITALRDQGTISQTEFNEELQRMAENADGVDFDKLDLSKFSGDIDGVDLEKLRAMLAAIGEGTGDAKGLPSVETFVPARPEFETEGALAALEAIKGPQQQFIETQSALNELLGAGAISAEEYSIALNNATIASNTLSSSAGQGLAAGLAEVENRLTDISGAVASTVVNAFGRAEDAIVEFATTGEFNFSKFVDGLLADVTRILAKQAILALIKSIAGDGGEGGGGIFGSILGALGNGKAGGGPVSAGETAVVGEEGPEIVTFSGAGNVTPAGESAAIFQNAGKQAAPVVNVAPAQVNITNVSDPAEIPDGIESPEGEEAVMNVIRRNRRSVSQSL